MDWNQEGDLFTWDSDNERCIGLPWYEGTRFYHVRPGGHFVIKDVGILDGGFDVGVVQSLLHQLQVSGFPEQLGCEVVAKVVEPEVRDVGSGPDAFPC